MNKQIKAGADIHAGDGGYSEGTQEQYDAFVKVRNKSLAQGRIRELAEQAGWDNHHSKFDTRIEKFAELIVRECARLNRLQSYELMGVITDVEEGDGFDDVCLNTVKRVAERLANDLKEHFGVEE